MTYDEQKQIFAKNLSYLISQSGKQQKEVAKDLNISYTTLNTWTRGASMPNAAKIQTIADYFNVLKSDLLDSKIETEEKNFEKYAYLSMARRYLAYAIGLSALDIVTSLAKLNENGIKEIQKRIDEMLCVPKYKKEITDKNIYRAITEDSDKRYNSIGKEIESSETPK